MSKPLHEVADAVRSLKRFTDAVATLGEFVENAASAEQAASEAQQRLADKQAQEAGQNERLRSLSDAISMAEADVARAKGEALATVNKGRTDAGVAIRDAERKADKIIADAEYAAERLKGPLNADIVRLSTERVLARADLAGIVKAQDEAKAELDAINTQLASARKAIASLLKG